MAGGAEGGGAKSGDGKLVKAIATAGGAARDRSGSGSGGPVRARPGRFRPWSPSPSYVSRRRRFGVGAKIVDPDEDAVGDGEAGVVANQDGAAAGAGQDGTAAGVRPGADQDTAAAGAGHVAEKTSK